MENTIQPKTNKKIITDPEKLKKNIKYSGLFGIILGALIIITRLANYIVLGPKADIASLYVLIVIGILYVVFGILIIKNTSKAKKSIYFLIGLSSLIVLLSLIGTFLGAQISLLESLIFAYTAELVYSLKYIKRLEGQKIGR